MISKLQHDRYLVMFSKLGGRLKAKRWVAGFNMVLIKCRQCSSVLFWIRTWRLNASAPRIQWGKSNPHPLFCGDSHAHMQILHTCSAFVFRGTIIYEFGFANSCIVQYHLGEKRSEAWNSVLRPHMCYSEFTGEVMDLACMVSLSQCAIPECPRVELPLLSRNLFMVE